MQEIQIDTQKGREKLSEIYARLADEVENREIKGALYFLSREKKNLPERSIFDANIAEKFKKARNAKEILMLALDLEMSQEFPKSREEKKFLRKVNRLIRELSDDVYRD